MKLRNLMGAVLALAGVAFCGIARADVAVGDIYSIDLVESGLYGGRIPTKESPLKIGEKAVIRLLDEGCTLPFIARYRKEQHGSSVRREGCRSRSRRRCSRRISG